MYRKLFRIHRSTVGITAAGWFLATLVAGQAAALWGDVKTFMTESDLNGAHVQFTYGDTTRHAFAGVFRAEMSDGQAFLAFCTDALNTLSSGLFTPYAAMPDNNLETNPIWANGGGARAAVVYNAHISSVYGMSGSTGPGSTAGDIAAAALQVAIWKALYDDTTSLNDGLFRMVSNGSALQNDIIAQANLFLNGALAGYDDPEGASNGNPNAMWWQPINQDGSLRAGQGLIGPLSNSSRSVPAPQGFALASLLAGGFGFLARRRMTG